MSEDENKRKPNNVLQQRLTTTLNEKVTYVRKITGKNSSVQRSKSAGGGGGVVGMSSLMLLTSAAIGWFYGDRIQ